MIVHIQLFMEADDLEGSKQFSKKTAISSSTIGLN